MKKVFYIIPLIVSLVGCNKSPEWIAIKIWDDGEHVASVYIEENSTNNINMTGRRQTIVNGTIVSDKKMYTKEYCILDGFYGDDNIKYFDSYGRCLISSWTKELPTNIYTKYNSFDGYNFFTYTNNNDPRYIDMIDYVIPDIDVDICKISPNAYLKFELTFKGKATTDSVGIKIYDRYDSSKECFYTGTEPFSYDYTDHHIVFKVSTRAAYYGHIYLDFLTGSLNDVYLKNEIHKISYSLTKY